jgi:hypothetical protein
VPTTFWHLYLAESRLAVEHADADADADGASTAADDVINEDNQQQSRKRDKQKPGKPIRRPLTSAQSRPVVLISVHRQGPSRGQDSNSIRLLARKERGEGRE